MKSFGNCKAKFRKSNDVNCNRVRSVIEDDYTFMTLVSISQTKLKEFATEN